MDKYTVEFRIYGSSMDTEAITKSLGLIPSTTQLQGQRRSERSEFRESMWGFGKTCEDGMVLWDDLEKGIRDLLDVLLPVKAKITSVHNKSKTIFWCAHIHNTFGAGPSLSNSLMRTMAEFEASIIISTYYELEADNPISEK